MIPCGCLDNLFSKGARIAEIRANENSSPWQLSITEVIKKDALIQRSMITLITGLLLLLRPSISSLLQSATAFFITKCDECYYKVRQVFKSVTRKYRRDDNFTSEES